MAYKLIFKTCRLIVKGGLGFFFVKFSIALADGVVGFNSLQTKAFITVCPQYTE